MNLLCNFEGTIEVNVKTHVQSESIENAVKDVTDEFLQLQEVIEDSLQSEVKNISTTISFISCEVAETLKEE